MTNAFQYFFALVDTIQDFVINICVENDERLVNVTQLLILLLRQLLFDFDINFAFR